ncbi:MAG TPA: AsmA family protein [bacterium]|nr:AsmA family protein [bacterium]
MDRKQAKTLKRKRRLTRLLLWVFSLIMGLISALLIVIWLYPARPAGDLASRILTRELGRPVRIESVNIRLPGSVYIEGIQIGFPSEAAPVPVFFSLRRLGVQFRILPLLRRRIEITGIRIEGPFVNLTVRHASPSGEKGTRPAGETRDHKSSDPLILPLALSLFRLKLEDFSLSLPLDADENAASLFLDGFNLDVRDLHIPRDPDSHSERLRGRIRLYTRQGSVRTEGKNESHFLPLDLNTELVWKSGGRWSFIHYFTIGDTATASNLRWIVNAKGRGMTGRADVETRLSLGGQHLLRIRGELEPLPERLLGTLTLDGDEVRLERMRESAVSLFPAAMTAVLDPYRFQGRVRLLEGRVDLDTAGLGFDVRSRWESLFAAADSLPIEFHGGSLNARLRGRLKQGKLFGGQARLAVRIDSTRQTVADTGVVLKAFDWDILSRLDSEWLPAGGETRLAVLSPFGGPMLVQGKWKIPNESSWKRVHSDWNLKIDTLRLENLPGEIPVSGPVSFALDMNTRGLDKTRLDWNLGTSALIMPEDTLAPLRFRGGILADLDPDSSRWRLDSLEFQINDCLFTRGQAYWNRNTETFGIEISEMIVTNDRVMFCLPNSMARSFRQFDFKGHEILWGRVHGDLKGDLLLAGGVRFFETGMHTADSLKAEGLEGELTLQGDAGQMQGHTDLMLNVLRSPFRSSPLSHTRLTFQWQWDGKDLTVTNGLLDLPSLFMKNRISGYMVMQEKARWNVRLENEFASEDSIEIIRDGFLQGRWNLGVDLGSAGTEGDIIRLQGLWDVPELSVSRGEGFRIGRLWGRIPLDLKANLSSMTLCAGDGIRFRPGLDYEQNRTLYRNAFDALGRLQVRDITLNRIRMDELDLDLIIESGEVQIPWFEVYVFDGNVGGSMRLDMAGKPPNEARYEIRAQASRINSAVLAGVRRDVGEKTEINATMAFRGTGFDIRRGIELDGTFHITQMGPRFASTLLQGMDPLGSDRSIQMTRKLLNTGWKPRLFSFELRHGYVYPSLLLTQPWFSPVRIPGKLEYGRLPLNFFIQSMMR